MFKDTNFPQSLQDVLNLSMKMSSPDRKYNIHIHTQTWSAVGFFANWSTNTQALGLPDIKVHTAQLLTTFQDAYQYVGPSRQQILIGSGFSDVTLIRRSRIAFIATLKIKINISIFPLRFNGAVTEKVILGLSGKEMLCFHLLWSEKTRKIFTLFCFIVNFTLSHSHSFTLSNVIIYSCS